MLKVKAMIFNGCHENAVIRLFAAMATLKNANLDPDPEPIIGANFNYSRVIGNIKAHVLRQF